MWDVLINLAWAMLAVLVLFVPGVWLGNFLAGRLMAWLKRPKCDGLPCPVCGYDCRGFDRRQKSHRCPECGVELRWGQLARANEPSHR